MASQAALPPCEVACVAVIGNNNSPLFLKVYKDVAQALPRRADESLELQMQEVVYNSLDVIEERMFSTRVLQNQGFLGCLSVVGPISLYGLSTCTKEKIVVGFRKAAEVRDAVLEAVLRAVHRVLVEAYLNPFMPLDLSIRSKRFEAKVDEIAEMRGDAHGGGKPGGG
mmetsp:Transcript_6187/g.15033  ORF Transcript_6187/g.15033 Transcript_6187/m.15033 type:complete len:168 (+) Transcript_6187:86-589(+)